MVAGTPTLPGLTPSSTGTNLPRYSDSWVPPLFISVSLFVIIAWKWTRLIIRVFMRTTTSPNSNPQDNYDYSTRGRAFTVSGPAEIHAPKYRNIINYFENSLEDMSSVEWSASSGIQRSALWVYCLVLLMLWWGGAFVVATARYSCNASSVWQCCVLKSESVHCGFV